MPKSRADKVAEVRSLLTRENRKNLYETSRFLDLDTRYRMGLTVPCRIYFRDPSEETRPFGLTSPDIQEINLRWEPSLGDGPTSARLAVVDYDGDHGILWAPARWDEKAFSFFTDDGRPVNEATDSPQFLQVNAWATVQRVLEFYEDPRVLGRPIPWAFEGNRLMIVPRAGYRENAYYDRNSKSLQLYYYGDPQGNPGGAHHTCLSHDIIAHEVGHALLDGIRPCLLENSSWETAAFHEFVGDLTAILMAVRNKDEEQVLADETFADRRKRAEIMANVAEQLGTYVDGRPFLRTAHNKLTFSDAKETRSAHTSSQVLTGAMFDILISMARAYCSTKRQKERARPASPKVAFWWAAEFLGRTALQPLDLLPPVDVRFLDYARAVLCNDELNNPEDVYGYRKLIRRIFHKRGLCPQPINSCDPKTCPLSWEKPYRLDIFHDLAEASRSRAAAYRLVNDNRKMLRIPYGQDFSIADVYDCNKLGYSAERLPRQVVIQYVWREGVELDEPRFGRLRGETVHLMCGGTLLFDDRGNLLWWTAKHGRGTPEGEIRRKELLDHLAWIVASRRLTLAEELIGGGLPSHTTGVVAHRMGGALRLETAFHLCRGAEEEDEWTTSF